MSSSRNNTSQVVCSPSNTYRSPDQAFDSHLAVRIDLSSARCICKSLAGYASGTAENPSRLSDALQGICVGGRQLHWLWSLYIVLNFLSELLPNGCHLTFPSDVA